MNTTDLRPARRRTFEFLLAAVALVAAFATSARAAKFWHAALGRTDIYTSDSPENTKEFICELQEVRRQIQELVAPVPLPNPRMEVVVFNLLQDYKEFVPVSTVTSQDMTTVSGFSAGDYGLTIAVVKEGKAGYQFGRHAVLFYYAYYLLCCAVGDLPLWIQTGLPEVLGATECRRGRVYIGGDFMNHHRQVVFSKLIPLERLMDDAEMQRYFNAPKHDDVLYHESWALWQQWLTDPAARRQQVGRLFAAIRNGAKGDFSTVAQSFGETKEGLEKAHRTDKPGNDFPTMESNPAAESLLGGLTFQPATELDGKFALAMLFGRTGKGLGAFGYEFLQLAQAHPDSPRPVEALAALATGAGDPEGAALRWEKARELNTDNPFAYLLPVLRALGPRQFNYSLGPQLPESGVTQWRQWLDRCVQLDPACAEAFNQRVMVEAFAPRPDKASLDRAEQSHTLDVSPLSPLYLAIARWRLGETAEAHRLLAGLLQRSNLTAAARQNIAVLQAVMQKAENRPAEAAEEK